MQICTKQYLRPFVRAEYSVFSEQIFLVLLNLWMYDFFMLLNFFSVQKNTSNANIFVIFVSSFLSNIEIVVALKYILGCVKTEF